MNNLLENQTIGKRKRYLAAAVPKRFAVTQRTRTPISFKLKRPGIIDAFLKPRVKQNSRFIDNIEQKPQKIKRFSPQQVTEQIKDDYKEPIKKDAEKSSIFTTVRLTVVFLVIFGVFLVFHSQGGSLDWLDREVVNLGAGNNSQHSLALYARAGAAAPGVMRPENAGVEIPLDLMETFAWQSYTVRRGDSVSKIAAAFSVSMDAIISSNGISNARALREGEVLRIPNMDGIPYIVQQGDSLTGISIAKGVPLEAILDANDIQSEVITPGTTLFIPGARMNREDLRMALGELFVFPVRGARLTSPFGWRNDPFTGVRRFHAAVDLAAPQGTPIWAAKEGRVSAMGFNAVYGNFIILEHPGGFQTLYAHLHTFAVRRGDQVRQGAQIGTVGNTGLSTGPHLHFAVFRNNRAVNPLDFLSHNR